MSETSGTLVAFVECGKYRLSLLYNILLVNVSGSFVLLKSSLSSLRRIDPVL